MNPEEFLAFIKKTEEEDKRYEGLYKAFSKKLPKELAGIVFAQLPEMKEKRDTVYDDVYWNNREAVQEVILAGAGNQMIC